MVAVVVMVLVRVDVVDVGGADVLIGVVVVLGAYVLAVNGVVGVTVIVGVVVGVVVGLVVLVVVVVFVVVVSVAAVAAT